jgi:Tol biopolymer transport system component
VNTLARAGALAFLIFASACASTKAVELERLPAEPIAFLFIPPDKARDFASRLQEARGKAPPANEGVAQLGKLQRLLRSDETSAAGLIGHAMLLDPRTSETTPLETLVPGSRPLEWSADHERLLFAGPRFDILQISELHVTTGEIRTFTQGKDDHPSASLASDGRLAFTRWLDPPGGKPDSRIFVTNVGGAEPQPVTSGPTDAGPDWSPDGAEIVYQTRLADGNLAIGALAPLDAPPRILTHGRDAVFTPDGQWIVYSARLASGFKLWRMRPDGSGKLALGEAAGDFGDEMHPAVSPDGRYVVYVAEKDGRHSLRIRRFDGGGDRDLLNTGDAMLPVW